MNIGYTVWTWILDPFGGFAKADTVEKQKVDFECGLREISHLGYDTVENFNVIVDMYEDNMDELKELLKKYKLNFGAVYTYFKTDFEAEMEMGRRCIKFLKNIDCDILNLQAPKHAPEGTTDEDVLETARKADILGKLCYENGIKLCMHPHWGSTVEKEAEIKLFMDNTNPEWVKMCIDTAHTQVMEIDPIKLIDTYQDRLHYIHFKDVDPDVTVTPERPMNRFCAVGQGTVDFKGVYKKLKEIGYDGVVCVELDYPKICNYQSAESSRKYIHDVLGV